MPLFSFRGSVRDQSDLAGRVARGEENAVDEFYRVFRTAMIPKMRRIWGADFEDRLHDCFVQAWLSIGSVRETDNLGAWLGGVVVHYVCRFFEHKEFEDRVRRQSKDPGNQRMSWMGSSFAECDPYAQLLAKERRAIAKRCLATMDQEAKPLFRGIYFEQKSYAQVSAELGICEGAVRNRKNRQLRFLDGAGLKQKSAFQFKNKETSQCN